MQGNQYKAGCRLRVAGSVLRAAFFRFIRLRHPASPKRYAAARGYDGQALHASRSTLLLSSVFLLASSLQLPASPAWAGGPIFVNSSGIASAWDNSDAIPYHPESGDCATFDNSVMLARLDENLDHWTTITGLSLAFDQNTGELGSVGATNYEDFIVITEDDPGLNDGLNPVIFDDDGGIVDDLFGEGSKFFVLGFAGPDGFNDDEDTILDGQAVFNCFCQAGNPNDTDDECADSGIVFTEDDLDFTMVHELGHFIGLDHTQVNQPLGDGGCDLDTEGDCDDLPAMYPVSEDAADQITPQRDDEVALLTLYGLSSWENDFCVVQGVLEDVDENPLRCADVQAETADTADAIAIVSGAFAPAEDTTGDGYTDDDGECLSNCGDFVLRGLDAVKNYTITVKPIDTAWVGGSSLNPCGSGQLTGIVEEEIATVSGCTAGETIDLGTIETESSGGTDSSGGDDGNSENLACGVDKNFENCVELISCSLNRSDETAHGSGMIFVMILFFILILSLCMSCRGNPPWLPFIAVGHPPPLKLRRTGTGPPLQFTIIP